MAKPKNKSSPRKRLKSKVEREGYLDALNAASPPGKTSDGKPTALGGDISETEIDAPAQSSGTTADRHRINVGSAPQSSLWRVILQVGAPILIAGVTVVFYYGGNNEAIDWLKRDVGEVRTSLKQVDEKVGAVGERLTKIETKVTAVEGTAVREINHIEKRVDEISARQERLAERLDAARTPEAATSPH